MGETIGHKLNVLGHETGVHTDQATGECVADKLILQNHGLADQTANGLCRGLLGLLVIQGHREERMKSFIARDQFIAEGETRKKAALLEPEDGTEGTTEEDALDRRKGRQTGGKARIGLDPLEGPLGLLGDARNGLNGVKQVVLLRLVLDLGINQQGLGLRMNAFHGVLKSLEQTGHGALDFALKADRQVLLHDPITACEEGQNGLNEMALVRAQGLKVVSREVDFLRCPEGGELLLLHGVEVLLVVGDGKESVTHDGISSIENVRSVLQEMSGSNRTDQLLQ